MPQSSNMCATGVLKQDKKEKGAEEILEDIIAENIPRTSRGSMNLKQD